MVLVVVGGSELRFELLSSMLFGWGRKCLGGCKCVGPREWMGPGLSGVVSLVSLVGVVNLFGVFGVFGGLDME